MKEWEKPITVSFNLRKEKVDKRGKHPVYAFFYCGGERYSFSIKGLKLTESQWDKKNKRIICSASNRKHNIFNAQLRSIEEVLEICDTHHRFVLKERISRETLKSIVDNKWEKQEVKTENQCLEMYNTWVLSRETKVAKRTLTGYRTVYNIIDEFYEEMELSGDASEVNEFFYLRLSEFCKAKGLAESMFKRIISNFTSALEYGYNLKLHTNLSYLRFSKYKYDRTQQSGV